MKRSTFILQILSRRMVAFLVVLLLIIIGPTITFAARTVKGTITDKNGNAAHNVRVKALDNDPWPNPDDFMGVDETDSNGYYEIHYEGGHWDSAPHSWTIWRPDIFIRVSAPVNGWCDDGDWEPGRDWLHLQDSGVTSNHPHRYDLTKNLKLTNYPRNVPSYQTFVSCENMWCKVNFFFHANCLACADDGSKIEWSDWGITNPSVKDRCWFPPKPKCTSEDYEYIRTECMRAYLDVIVPAREYIALFAKSEEDDIDRKVAKELLAILKTAEDYYKGDKNEEGNKTMLRFKGAVESEHSKENISNIASVILIKRADIIIDAHQK